MKDMLRKSNYGVFEIIKNCIFVVLSKLVVPSARLLRFPIVIRGKKYINFGKHLTTGYRVRIEVNGVHDCKVLSFGDNVNMGDDCRIACASSIKIGNNVLIGSRVTIVDNSHGSYSGENQDTPFSKPNKRKLVSKPIIIGDNVWIGENVVILAGSKIGNGCIIGANAVVCGEFEDNCIIVGIPAKVIKRWNNNLKEWEKI